MHYNHALARKKFLNEWNSLRNKYLKAGATAEFIQQMYDYDYLDFKKERVFYEWNYALTDGISSKFITELMPTVFDSSRYGWIQELDSPILLQRIKTLTTKQLELITLYVFDGWKLQEIAKQQGITHSSISQQLATIRRNFKNEIAP